MSLREGYLKHAAPETIVTHLKDLHEKRRGIDREMQELSVFLVRRSREVAAGTWPPPKGDNDE